MALALVEHPSGSRRSACCCYSRGPDSWAVKTRAESGFFEKSAVDFCLVEVSPMATLAAHPCLAVWAFSGLMV